MTEILKEIAENLRNGEDEVVGQLTQKAIDEKIPAEEILAGGLIAGMDVVGDLFRRHDIFLPEVLLAARAMHAGMDCLRPLLIKAGIPSLGKVVIGSVRGDYHDIGKNLVGIMLSGAGFEIIDLGADVAPEKLVDSAVEAEAGVIGMSALLTTTMTAMKEVQDLLKERGLAGKIKTIVGGAPLSAEFAEEIGADAYGYDAANAVERVKALMQ